MKIRPRARKQPGLMNRWERRYAEQLEAERRAGVLQHWGYEAIRFVLAPNTSYTPDFMAVYADRIEFIEIKGQRRAAGMAKFKVAARLYPWAYWRMVELTKTGFRTIMEA